MARGSATVALAVCFALAGLSLALPSVPTTDSWGWIVWGREAVAGHLDTLVGGSPAWKPLPVLVTAPLSLFGSAAPALWLVFARATGLLALVAAYRLARRLGGTVAGVAAVICILGVGGWLRGLTHGYTEPLLGLLALVAADRHLDGDRRAAAAALLAAALARPEAFLFAAPYGLWVAYSDDRARPWIGAAVLAVPALWVGGDWWGAGTPLRGGKIAEQTSVLSGGDMLAGFGPTVGWATLAAALVAVGIAARRRDGVVVALSAWAVVWAIAVIALAAAGGPSALRFFSTPATLLCVVAGVGAGWLARTQPARGARATLIGGACVLSLAAAPFLDGRERAISGQLGKAGLRADLEESLERGAALAAAGRFACGPLTIPAWAGWARGAVAWTLDEPIDDVHTQPRPGPGPDIEFEVRGRRPLELRTPGRADVGAVYLVPLGRATVDLDDPALRLRGVRRGRSWTAAQVCPRAVSRQT